MEVYAAWKHIYSEGGKGVTVGYVTKELPRIFAIDCLLETPLFFGGVTGNLISSKATHKLIAACRVWEADNPEYLEDVRCLQAQAMVEASDFARAADEPIDLSKIAGQSIHTAAWKIGAHTKQELDLVASGAAQAAAWYGAYAALGEKMCDISLADPVFTAIFKVGWDHARSWQAIHLLDLAGLIDKEG